MKKYLNLKQYWYIWIVMAVYVLQAVVLFGAGGGAYIYYFDHLDLFAAHYEMLRRTGTWFSGDAMLPILHGVPRDLLGSELELYNLPYIFLPGIWAYLCSYALRVAVGFLSFKALAKDGLGERYKDHAACVWFCACGYSIIPVFPNYACAFVSLPLVVLLLRRIYYRNKASRKWLWLYLGLFLYPTLSYFSYHGIFILAYLCLAIIIIWIHDKKPPLRLLAAVPVLSAGYVIFEYRLFRGMVFSDTVSIRPGIKLLYLSFLNCVKTAVKEFIKPFSHSEDAHTYFILWICLAVAVAVIIKAIREKRVRSLFKDPLILILFMIGLNCLLMGFYHFKPLVTLVEWICPMLKGFDFSRASFLNPFLWYGGLLTALTRKAAPDALHPLIRRCAPPSPQRGEGSDNRFVPSVCCMVAMLVVCFLPDYNNDFSLTLYNRVHKAVTGEPMNYKTYDEFFSVELFDEIKEDIDYNGEWVVSFGLYPAVTCYNGFSTLDGYLGLYEQEYKDKWLEVIRPAWGSSWHTVNGFVDFGNKVYLAPSDDTEIYEWERQPEYESLTLLAEVDNLKELGLKYMLAPVPVVNAEEMGFSEPRVYTNDKSCYTIYLYELK